MNDRLRWIVIRLAALVCAVAGGFPAAAQDRDEKETRRTPLVERSESRLGQVQLSVFGPPEIAAGLTAEEFSIKVNLRKLESFHLDRLCPDPARDPGSANETPIAAPPTRVYYLFYFDQTHLTLAGRQRSLDVARELIPRLLRDGSEAMIVSNATRLAVLQEFTSDADTLLDGLERLERDRTQWDFFATEEESRVARVVEVLNEDNNVARAVGVARSFQREELYHTQKSMRRLAVMIARLADLPPPKAVVYFADNLRANAGEHYLSFFGTLLQRSDSTLRDMSTDSATGALPFDRVLDEASSHGVRFYSVKAEGLVMPIDRTLPSPSAMSAAGTIPTSSRTRFKHAQDTLANLASETGGRSFLRGMAGRKMAEKILADFSCLYVASFDPTGFPLDAPLRVKVKLLRDDVRLRSRGRIVLQSDKTRLTSRLLSAFALDRPGDLAVDLSTNLVATGYRDGRYSALLQVSVPATGLPTASWDVGASMLFRDQVREEISGRLAVHGSGIPLVLEEEVLLRPGANEIVAVAHESATDFILSDRVRVEWPDPDAQRAVCGPIALLQPAAGAFLRAGDQRTSGSLARSAGDTVDNARPTALTSLVCRGRRQRGTLDVQRSLSGAGVVDFPPLMFDLADERCAQVRDLIPAGTLSPGGYRYEVRVFENEVELHRSNREFEVLDPGS